MGGHSPTGGFLPDLGPDAAVMGVAASISPDVTRSETSAGLHSLAAASGSETGIRSAGAQPWSGAVATLRTTPIRRTIATLRGVLTGLWPRLAGPASTQRPSLPVRG